MLFGALAVGHGMTPLQATIMSAGVFAGASQFVAIDLMGQGVPMWSIAVSVLAVNFRHLLYSAAITPLIRPLRWRVKIPLFFVLVDPAFAYVQSRRPGFDVVGYFSLGVTVYAFWCVATFLGAMFGQLLTDPEAYALDMLLPIYFLALVMGFRSRANWGVTVVVTFLVSALVYKAPDWGVAFLGSPWHVTLGGLSGMLAAALFARRDPPELAPAAEPGAGGAAPEPRGGARPGPRGERAGRAASASPVGARMAQ